MKYIKIALILFLFNSLLIGQNSVELTKLLNKEYIKPMKKKDIIGMSLGIMENGKVVHTQSFGYSDLENNILANSDTEYKIGSISKLFTCIAILQLQDQGKIDINHSIRKYIPELNIQSRFSEGNDLIIRDIMCHGSGLPSDLMNGMFTSEPHDFNWVIEKVNQQYMSTPARTIMSYSNLGYGFLGELIARISGMSYPEYMLKNVFKPMEMHSSYIFNGEETLSRAYDKGALYAPDRIRDQAAGSVVSTINDMLKFIKMMSSGGKTESGIFLSEENIALIEKNHLEGNKLQSSGQYGLGVFIHPVKIGDKDLTIEDTYIEHGGDTYAFHAHFGYVKDRSIGGVILTNSKRGGSINSVHSLIDIYLDEKDGSEMTKMYAENPQLMKSKENVKDSGFLTGKYAFANFMIDVDNPKKIKLDLGGQKAILKQKKSTNTYKIRPILFGFLPIPLKNIEMVFFQSGDNIYISQNDLKSNRNQVIGESITPTKMNESWKELMGKYSFKDATETSFSVMDLTGQTCNLSQEGDFIKVTSTKENIMDEIYLQTHDDKMAYTIGIGRNTGYSLTKLPNGNLSFMGFEMEKVGN